MEMENHLSNANKLWFSIYSLPFYFMQAELLKVIEANLPAEVGKTLQKRLEQAEAWELENATLKRDNEALKKENIEYKRKSVR